MATIGGFLIALPIQKSVLYYCKRQEKGKNTRDDDIDRDSEMQRKRDGKVRPGFAHVKKI